MTSRLNTLGLLFPALLLAVACETTEDLDVNMDEEVAIDAAIKSLDPVREDLEVEDEELDVLARDFIDITRADIECDVEGVVSGVWYDVDLRPVFEGSWFQLGTGELGGTITGNYGDGLYEGTAVGPDLEANVIGRYKDGNFIGEWDSIDADGTAGNGELGGQYERRNEHGGYFFGLWGDCSRVNETDPSTGAE